MQPARPIDFLFAVAAGGLVFLLSAVALRWPELPLSRIWVKLFASRGLSPRTNLILLCVIGLALVIAASVAAWIDLVVGAS